MAAAVPRLPEGRPLDLDDRQWLSAALWELRPEQSEFTFTNLFMWRQAYQFRLSQVDGARAAFAWMADPEESFLLPPLGPGAGAASVRRCLEHMARAGHNARMARATERDLRRLGVTEEEFAIAEDRDQWDYVYLVRDLIELSGNRYHGKRNHVEQFARAHAFRYVPLTAERVAACVELQDQWCDEKHCDLVATLRAEARAVKEVLSNAEALGIAGGCIEVEGKVEAFTLGELLNPETVVIHIEKANPAFHGLYQVINQQFLEQQWPSVRFVNREQDLGVPGLRRAKESYHPHHLVEKYVVRLK